MSTTQNLQSPRPRGKHQRSRSGGPPARQPVAPSSGTRSQRRRNNRAHNANTHNPVDPSFTDSAIMSSEDVAVANGPRNPPKKHTHSQPAADRIFTPTGVANASLTDTELSSQNQSTPKAQAAYAGPTFHASPAPSTLPIPKFLSKSVPAKTRVGPPTPPPDEESSDASSPTPSPSRATVPIPSRHQDSPLDMLFKADRAERARNSNGSPAAPFHPSGRPHHIRHESYGSLNAPFPIELDGDSRQALASPPTASPAVHRSVTAPCNIPQAQSTAPTNDNGALQDLLSRLSMSQKNLVNATPPKTVEHVPSDPSLRTHASPFHDGQSPFRSSSGPTTPVQQPPANPDFFYGNRNLSPLFKAASKKLEDSPRNSSLRTEITADSPTMLQGGFSGPANTNANSANNANGANNANNANNMTPRAMMNGPASPRAHVHQHQHQHQQPFRGSPNQYKRGANRRSYQSRPDTFNANRPANDASHAPPAPSPKANMMAFVPSSVRAKPKATTDAAPLKAATPPPPGNNQTLENDLKRMLNLGMTR